MTQTTSKKRRARSAASKTLHVAFVWDMSGSMASVWNASIEGFNDYVRQLQDDEEADTTRFTVTAFDTVFEHWYTDVPVREIPSITHDRYCPRGCTALYDAIAHTIQRLDTHIKGSREEKVLVVVLTDGEENSSVEYARNNNGRARLASLVEAYTARGNWTFVYLGANDPDVEGTATSIGVPVSSAAYYSSDPASMSATFTAMAEVTRSRKGSSSMSSNEAFADANLGTDYRTAPAPPPASSSATITKTGIGDLLGGSS